MATLWNLRDLQDLEREVPLQPVLTVLRDRAARYSLYTLQIHDEMTLREVADVATAWEHAAEQTVVSPADRDAVRNTLYHVHLPRLAGAGIVDFDPEAKTVSFDDPPPELLAFLDDVRLREQSATDSDSAT